MKQDIVYYTCKETTAHLKGEQKMLNKDDYNISIVDILMYELGYSKEEATNIANDNELK